MENFTTWRNPGFRRPNSKTSDTLTRASSLPRIELIKENIVQEWQSNDSKQEPHLIKQYSCEEIRTNKDIVKTIVTVDRVHMDKDSVVKFWEDPILKNYKSSMPTWETQDNIMLPTTSDTETEYMDLSEENLGSTSRLVSTEPRIPKSASSDNSQESTVSKLGKRMGSIFLDEKRASKNSDDQTEKIKESSDEVEELLNQDSEDDTRSLVSRRSTKRKSKFSWNCGLFFVALSLFISTVSIILQQEDNRHSSDFVDAVTELKKRIYGQDRAVEILSEYLLLDEPSLKVIALVGGTGIGKSYTMEIIKENFPRRYYITQFFPPIKDTDATFILYPQLIILENLRESDLVDLMGFLKTLKKDVNDRCMTILTVFNFERMDDKAIRSINLNESLKTLESFFVAGDIEAKVIPYHSLSEDVLEKCIADATRNSELVLSTKQVDLVKQYLFMHNAGCKGAYAKVQVIGRQ
ncbi:hypothetical protein DMN91_010589 [Ooceraea biroi]|uniref:Uncharacterized protein n=1 Tax=Ooceraea biroi TaxID=2015173 RepID=A0A026WV02_OOCBI|nr:uncharacterized protein LOC105275826 [Ooceraea biroi]XP_011331263.1 uncharacterized protein LOC105275826 [Ooceraea biroi]XP_011331264.1 uncharacterized protein LOC105275826 [Ooceraea biroi]EZA58934.1 hypothetical protein X777_16893 [Ooceraea biroi]RLU16521.1 hypothetical protein DMN91_010589 [Ooceraea biroi]